ncbi:hypothetical protein [Kitasatospora sp. NPDC097691]|uniref:hypothetical protein n=1 Tax=Kitasatospora sp. NPDC097691 TaxID=3157231 RepID=UPI00332D8F3A
MAKVMPNPQSFNVTVQEVRDTTSTELGSSFNVSSQAVTGTALSTPGTSLTVDFKVENSRGEAVDVTVRITDPSGSQSFDASGTITWDEGDTSTAWIEFSNFPPKGAGDPTGECAYAIVTSGPEVSARVFTV